MISITAIPITFTSTCLLIVPKRIMSNQLHVFKVMESTARLAICAPTPEGYAFEHLSKPQKILHSFALLFDFVDAIDMILDIIQGFRLVFKGERPMFGVFLLGGIVIARVVASKGERRSSDE